MRVRAKVRGRIQVTVTCTRCEVPAVGVRGRVGVTVGVTVGVRLRVRLRNRVRVHLDEVRGAGGQARQHAHHLTTAAGQHLGRGRGRVRVGVKGER